MSPLPTKAKLLEIAKQALFNVEMSRADNPYVFVYEFEKVDYVS